MKRSQLFFVLVVVFLAFVLSGCMGGNAVANSWTGVTTAGDVVYVARNQQVAAINLENRTEVWHFPLESENANQLFYAPPAITEDGQVIAGSYNGVLYSIDQENGNQNWLFEGARGNEGQYIASPLVLEGMIYAPSANGNLYALDSQGKLVWTFETENSLWATPTSAPDCGCIYLTSMDHNLYSISIEDGSLDWKRDLGASIVGKPALSEEQILFVGTFGKKMFAVDASDGDVIWEQTVTDWVWEGPVLHEENLYFGDLSGNIYALSQKDGSILWQQKPGGPIVSSPLILGDELYFTTRSGEIIAMSTAGQQVWMTKIEKAKLFSPVKATENELILVAPSDNDAVLMAFMPKENTQRWVYPAQEQ